MKKKLEDDFYNLDDLKKYISLSPKQKLSYLEEINSFLFKITPLASKKVCKKLKKQGW